jgi:hypothetical protein
MSVEKRSGNAKKREATNANVIFSDDILPKRG